VWNGKYSGPVGFHFKKILLCYTYMCRFTGQHSNNTVVAEHPQYQSSLLNIPQLGPSASQPVSPRSNLVLSSVSLSSKLKFCKKFPPGGGLM
jgi:hypothetical protein